MCLLSTEGSCNWNEEVVVVEGTFAVTVWTCETEDSGRTSADEAAPVDEDRGIVVGVDEGPGGRPRCW